MRLEFFYACGDKAADKAEAPDEVLLHSIHVCTNLRFLLELHLDESELLLRECHRRRFLRCERLADLVLPLCNLIVLAFVLPYLGLRRSQDWRGMSAFARGESEETNRRRTWCPLALPR